MREFGSSSLSLSGSILVAHPGLLDPNFRKSVLFLSSNDPQEGSFGLALNRPAGRTVGDVLPEREMGALSRVPVLLGGPVSRDQLIFAAFHWQETAERLECRTHIDASEAERILREQEGVVVRAFVGYAGWGKGQLEGELAQRAWLVKRPDADAIDILDPMRIPELWKELTGSFGPWFRLIADAPEDVSRN